MRWVITYVAHLGPAKAAIAGIPSEISDYAVAGAENREQLSLEVTKGLRFFSALQGMVTRQNPDKVFGPAKLDTDRRLVPAHMYYYTDAHVAPLTGEEAMIDEDGKTMNPSGAPLVTQ